MKPRDFVDSLQNVRLVNVFNPYVDRCPCHDVQDAPLRRSLTMLGLLEIAAKTEIDSLWIGRDLGHRGGRRTGLALTDDVHLITHGKRWNISVERATTGSMVAERTAAVIWSMLNLVSAPVFLWNVFPFHPHETDDPFSNRSHRSTERVVGEALLHELISILRPRQLVAIGNDAAKVAFRLASTSQVVQVRHPSYRGQTDFVRQVRHLYKLHGGSHQLKLSWKGERNPILGETTAKNRPA